MEPQVGTRHAGGEAATSDTAPAIADGASRNLRELDRRVNDGIDVSLLWCERNNLLFVEVADGKTGQRFSIEVRDGERPLDVFRHPFAYAAWRGADMRDRNGVVPSAR